MWRWENFLASEWLTNHKLSPNTVERSAAYEWRSHSWTLVAVNKLGLCSMCWTVQVHSM